MTRLVDTLAADDAGVLDVEEILPVAMGDSIFHVELGQVVVVLFFNEDKVIIFLLLGLLVDNWAAEPAEVGDEGQGMVLCQPASTAVEDCS